MKQLTFVFTFSSFLMLTGCSWLSSEPKTTDAAANIEWQAGLSVEDFWKAYANSRGGITWGASDTYPEYSKVKEGDTFLVQVKQGPCLMEFFHNRWRRANDVRRWDESINTYGGCPYVFD